MATESSVQSEKPVDYSSVKTSIEKFNVYFAHGISGRSTYLTDDRQGFETMLQNIIINPRIELCSSTFSPGESGNFLFVNSGVLIADGKVSFASKTDHMSYSGADNHTISGEDQVLSDKNPSDQIIDAITNKTPGTYNEINVGSARLAGLFITDAVDSNHTNKMIRLSQEYGLPLYRVKNGETYLCRIDNETGSVNIDSSPVTPVELADYTDTCPQEITERIKDSFAKNFPFKYARSAVNAVYQGAVFDFEQRISALESLRDKSELTMEEAIELYAWADTAEQPRYPGSEKPLAVGSNEARQLASKLLSIEQYRNLRSRISPDGQLGITRQELDTYFQTGTINLFDAKAED